MARMWPGGRVRFLHVPPGTSVCVSWLLPPTWGALRLLGAKFGDSFDRRGSQQLLFKAFTNDKKKRTFGVRAPLWRCGRENIALLLRIIDGCRELTGNWFSPRGAVGTQRDQSPISPEVSANIASGAHASPKQLGTTSEEISRALRFSPTRSLRAPLLLQPRWRRGHEERSNRHIEHQKRELRVKHIEHKKRELSCKKSAFTRAAHTRTVKLF